MLCTYVCISRTIRVGMLDICIVITYFDFYFFICFKLFCVLDTITLLQLLKVLILFLVNHKQKFMMQNKRTRLVGFSLLCLLIGADCICAKLFFLVISFVFSALSQFFFLFCCSFSVFIVCRGIYVAFFCFFFLLVVL